MFVSFIWKNHRFRKLGKQVHMWRANALSFIHCRLSVIILCFRTQQISEGKKGTVIHSAFKSLNRGVALLSDSLAPLIHWSQMVSSAACDHQEH